VKDIAEICGVSIGSVDRAIHNRPGINNETRKRILEACEEYGFRINRFAQSLSRQSFRFAAILPGKDYDFYRIMEKGLRQAADDMSDLNVSLAVYKSSAQDQGSEREIFTHVGIEEYNGIVLCSEYVSELGSLIDKTVSMGIPVITMGTDIQTSKRATTVAVSPEKTGEIAASYMTRFVRQPGTVCVLAADNDAMGQVVTAESFLGSIHKNRPDLIAGNVYRTVEDDKSLREAIGTILKQHPDLTGLYLTAWGGHILAGKLEELGLQESIVFFASGIYKDLWPYLDNGTIDLLVHRNPFRQGFQAVNLLFDILTGKEIEDEKNHVRPEFIIRESLWYYR